MSASGRHLVGHSPTQFHAPARVRPQRDELDEVQALVDVYGTDSIAPFIVRPDKQFHRCGDVVIAYRRVGGTLVISSDPVGPPEEHAAAFADLRRAERGTCIIYGAGTSDLEMYRQSGMHTLCTGEEAIVHPADFTLHGRSMRKLRQSVQRMNRRGWTLEVVEGVHASNRLLAEIEAVEQSWRQQHRRLIGFVMSFAEWEHGARPSDLLALARAPEGDLRAVMRFLGHPGGLSLDTMRRIGETPNGLNEALICRVLGVAAERGIEDVSLNYAGLAHLARREAEGGPLRRGIRRLTMRALSRCFQLERLVHFNDKFSPEWRPRYLVYESPLKLPWSILRVLQAEGYLPGGRGQNGERRVRPALRRLPPLRPERRRLLGVALAVTAAAVAIAGGVGAYSYVNDYSVHRGFPAVPEVPHSTPGHAVYVHFFSAALHRRADYIAFLPPGYTRAHRYPVFYLLHGMPGHPALFLTVADLGVRMDNLIALGRLRPMILVFPDGRIGGRDASDSEWANTPTGHYEGYVLDVMHDVDARFSTRTGRWNRAIGGYSAGAYGALNIALHHLHDFAVVQVWSGYFRQTRSGVFARAGPARLAYNSPYVQAARVAPAIRRLGLDVVMYAGRSDPDHRKLPGMAARLRAIGASVSAHLYPGGHDWGLWVAHLDQMLHLASRDMGTAQRPAGTVPPSATRPPGWELGASAAIGSRVPHRRGSSILIAALALAILSGTMINLGFVMQHRAAHRHAGDALPLVVCLRDRIWLWGQLIGWTGWIGTIVAIAVAPLTLVQAFIAGSVALSTPLAARLFHAHITRTQVAAAVLVGLALLTLAVGVFSHHHHHVTEGILIAAALGGGAVAVALTHTRRAGATAVGAGIFYGIADAAIKAEAITVQHHGITGIASGWTVLAAAASFGGFLAFQAALRHDDAVTAIALMNAFTAVVAIALGMAVFSERLGSGAVGLVVHAAAICVVLACVWPLTQGQQLAGAVTGTRHGRPAAPAVGRSSGARVTWPVRLVAIASAPATLLASLVGIGLLYEMQSHGWLGGGPGVGDSLPLLSLARHAGQPVVRVVIAFLLSGLLVGLGLRAIRHGPPLALIALVGAAVLVVTADASFALTENLRFTTALVDHAPGLGPWLEALLLILGVVLGRSTFTRERS